MRLSTANEMMLADKNTVEKYGVPTLLLMEHAAQAVVSEMEKRDLVSNKKIVVVCGKGNNGGDGYAIARLLYMTGADVSVINAFAMTPVGKDAEINFNACKSLGVPFVTGKDLKFADIIVDALFGVGMNNRLNDFCGEIVHLINESKAYVVAVDLPSGAYGDAAFQINPCVEAELTVTFSSYKPSQIFYPSAYNCGDVVCCDIGIPDDCFVGRSYVVDKKMISESIPKRQSHGHKGTFGKLLCIGGGRGYSGAVYLSTLAAVRTGCGTVKACIPEGISEALEAKTTEVMTVPLPEDKEGFLSFDGYGKITQLVREADTVLFGCGIGRGEGAVRLLSQVITAAKGPVVIDADGLYGLVDNLEILTRAKVPVILTPHLGEMSAISGMSVDELMGEPIECATKFARRWGVYLVMKSATTVIATPEGVTYINTFGNSGMAKGGSGDVLSGIIASLLCQGADGEKASFCGVGIHALAGDFSAKIHGEYSLTPSDIIENIGKSILSIL